MSRQLLRAAFEGADGVVRFTVLCSGCAADLVSAAEARQRPFWTRPACGVSCELCDGEVLAEFGS